MKMVASSSSTAPKMKKVKVLTHRPRPHSIKRTAAILDTKRIEIAEHAEAIPLALETIPTVKVEASADPVEESEIKSSKAEEHSKLLSPPTITSLPRLTIVVTMTPKKRRMASVLDAVLKSTNIPTHASIEAPKDNIEESREVPTASASSTHAEAETSGAKPAELTKEGLHEKPTLLAPKAASQVVRIYCSSCFGETTIRRTSCRSATLCKGSEIPPGILRLWRERRR